MYIDEAYFQNARERMVKHFQLILDTYFEECSAMIDSIQQPGSEANIETMTRAAHSIKSTSAALGAQKLSQLAANIEARYASGDLTDWAADKKNLEMFFQSTKEEINRLMA